MLQEQHSLLAHNYNFESANKKPSFIRVAGCVFSDVILVSNYHRYKEETIGYYHIMVFMQVTSPKISWAPSSGSTAQKKNKATRIPIYQHSPKNFQTSFVIKSATFHIKHNVATTSSLQNINWLPDSKIVWANYVKEKMFIVIVYIPSPYNVFLFFLKGQVLKTIS